MDELFAVFLIFVLIGSIIYLINNIKGLTEMIIIFILLCILVFINVYLY